ncbi:MAG: zinc-ribbon domain-containing protein, partial [Anaerolineae bacterium]
MIRCPSCGTLNKDSRRACSNCGAALPQTKIKCPKCGTLNPIGNLFCDHCNARLIQAEEVIPPDVSPEDARAGSTL